MYPLELPSEIWLAIAQYLSPKDWVKLILVNTQLCQLLQYEAQKKIEKNFPRLYRNVQEIDSDRKDYERSDWIVLYLRSDQAFRQKHPSILHQWIYFLRESNDEDIKAAIESGALHIAQLKSGYFLFSYDNLDLLLALSKCSQGVLDHLYEQFNHADNDRFNIYLKILCKKDFLSCKKYFDVNKFEDKYFMHAIYLAIATGNIPLVKAFLDSAKEDILILYNHQHLTMAMVAAKHNQIEILRLLLTFNSPFQVENWTINIDYTLTNSLDLAIYYGSYEAAKRLLAGSRGYFGISPFNYLLYAVITNDVSMARLILSYHPSNSINRTYRIEGLRTDVIGAAIISQKKSPEDYYFSESLPNFQFEMIQLLTKSGASKNINKYGNMFSSENNALTWHYIHFAAEKFDWPTFKLLVDHYELPTFINEPYKTNTLSYACFNQSHGNEIVLNLLKMGISFNAKSLFIRCHVKTEEELFKKLTLPAATKTLLKISNYQRLRREERKDYVCSFFCFNFGFSKQQKLAAAQALMDYYFNPEMSQGKRDEMLKPHLPALHNGRLAKIYKEFQKTIAVEDNTSQNTLRL